MAMLRAALKGQDRLQLDDRELRRSGPSFSVDTLQEFRSECGPQRPLVLLLGVDAFAGLPAWHCWQTLFELAHIGVLTRPGHSPVFTDALQREVQARRIDSVETIAATPAGHVIDIAVSALEISATHIRSELAAGREPRYLVADALLNDAALLAPYRNGST
jgi:nicotinate-nucleotide adenylyltransferase